MSRPKLLGLVAVMVLGALPALAQGNSPAQYAYDELRRLTKVVDQNGNTATYHYDAVGNLLCITRTAQVTSHRL
jgi:YD repeat-containing protein